MQIRTPLSMLPILCRIMNEELTKYETLTANHVAEEHRKVHLERVLKMVKTLNEEHVLRDLNFVMQGSGPFWNEYPYPENMSPLTKRLHNAVESGRWGMREISDV